MKKTIGFGSLCVHEEKPTEIVRPHLNPVHFTSSFNFDHIQQGIDIFSGKESGHTYSRYGNPTVELVAKRIAKLAGYGLDFEPTAYMTSSGMSAISTIIAGLLKQGDKVLTQGNLYGGTTELLVRIFSQFGIEPIFTDLNNLDEVESIVKADDAIKMIYLETPANPTLACVDLEALGNLAKKHQIYSVVDNTFCTPYLQQPLAYGIDFVIHSTTKYLNGHGNSISGIIIGKDETLMQEKVWKALKLMGTNCNPFDAWLTNNGLKTLELRMDRHGANALAIAHFLEKNDAVLAVNYPGLPSHKDHQLACQQMRNFGGMLSFEIKGGLQAGINFMNKVQFCSLAPTLGDVDTLILHPASSSHVNVDKALREANGIRDGLIRLSVGIENVEDIIADIEQAL